MTFSKPSASLMPSHTAESVSSADERPLSWAETAAGAPPTRCGGRARLGLGILDGDRDVRGHRAQHLEVERRGAPAAERLVDGQEAEGLACAEAQRHEEGVVRVPGPSGASEISMLRHVGDLRPVRGPVESPWRRK